MTKTSPSKRFPFTCSLQRHRMQDWITTKCAL